MATNGNDPRLQELENTLRGVAPTAPVAEQVDAIYDLATRVRDTTKAMRDLAQYSNTVADDLERTILSYLRNMDRFLGKIGQ